MILFLIYKLIRRLKELILIPIEKIACYFILNGNKVKYQNYHSIGVPYVMVARGGSLSLGANFIMVNGIKGNPIGCYNRCTFFVNKGAQLTIGNNVGISQTALICHQSISIGNYVKIGGGVCIYDTDFHPIDPKIRMQADDTEHRIKAPVVVHDNAFIGAFSIILKGVTIGKNSIIGAGSVVTKSIPENQIWAGNPAKFIKEIVSSETREKIIEQNISR